MSNAKKTARTALDEGTVVAVQNCVGQAHVMRRLAPNLYLVRLRDREIEVHRAGLSVSQHGVWVKA